MLAIADLAIVVKFQGRAIIKKKKQLSVLMFWRLVAVRVSHFSRFKIDTFSCLMFKVGVTVNFILNW